MKYYVYISNSKIDMLLPQVPVDKKIKIAAEIGVNIGILNAKLCSEAEQASQDTQVSRLNALTRYIEATVEPSTLEVPCDWIRNELEVKHLKLPQNPNVFIMVGKKYDKYYLLGGSTHHVVGNSQPEGVTMGYSYLPYLVEHLEKSLSEEEEQVREFKKKLYGGEVEFMAGIREHEWAKRDWSLVNMVRA